MAPLEGATLGQRHRHYNELLAKALKTNIKDIPKINYDDDDVDNMMRIDIACHNRDVDYILDVFKCDDMLYMTRALKHSTWLITEDQYSYIINPDYLHNNLFPEMMAKAITKLMLHVRRYLKDEERRQAFYTYVNNKNPKQALKWLANCSSSFIREIIPERTKDMDVPLIKRIGRKSLDILKEIIETTEQCNSMTIYCESLLLLRSHVDAFLDVIDSRLIRSCHYGIPPFTPKTTDIIMKNRPERIFNNFHMYIFIVHLPTVAKYIKRENIKQFMLTKIITNRCFDVVKPFIVKLPRDDILDFLKELFHVGNHFKKDGDNRSEAEALFNAVECNNKTFKNVYRWYEFAPLDVAFRDLKSFIYAESSAEERHSMLITLLRCCGTNLEQGKTVIKYYHDRHINEPYIHKITFINAVLDQYDVFRFDDDLWNTLNELFHSLEVYIESNNKVQKCLQNIIVYKVLRNDTMPEIVEQKFEFNSLKNYKNKFNNDEKEKVFQYLYKYLLTKLNNQTLRSETSMKEAISVLSDLWTLVKDWKKQELYHEFVTNKVIELSEINESHSWDTDMRYLYWMVKPYQKALLDRSILLYPHEDIILNILRHDAEVLEKYKHTVLNLCCNDKISLKRVFSKLRIYWNESLRNRWSDTITLNFDKTAGHKSFIKGIFILLQRSEILDFIKKYAPSENKINWSEDNEVTVSLRKHIAKNMHLSRPQLPAEIVLLYAKGDYLQYAVLSLNTIYYNLRSIDVEKHIHMLLNAPVSLQKHGIRLAFRKLKTEEFISISQNNWKSTKNSSIRATIFPLLFDTLCKETSLVDSIWNILESFIDDLEQDENKIIYETLGCRIESVPISIVGKFYQKSFIFLKSLQHKPECEMFLNRLIYKAENLIEYLENDFVENILLSHIGMYNIIANHEHLEILAAYLLYSKNVNIQMLKYNNLITPVLEKCSPQWESNGERSVLDGLGKLMHYIGGRLYDVFKNELVIPVKILEDIKQTGVKYLPITQFYATIAYWKLNVAFIKLLDSKKESKTFPWNTNKIKNRDMKPFALKCVEYLRNDVNEKFPSIYILFSQALEQTCQSFHITDMDFLNLLNYMLYCKDLQVYLTVLKLIPQYLWRDSERQMVDNIILKRIYKFPSEELKYHYFLRYNHKFNIDDEFDDEESHDSDSDGDESDSDHSGGDKSDGDDSDSEE